MTDGDRVAHFDPISGASGDMILGALVDAGAPLDEIRRLLATLPIPAFTMDALPARVHGFRALRLTIGTPHEHVHRHLADIEKMIAASGLPPWTKDASTRTFQRLAEAEARVHGIDIGKVHFHEVGALDSILDVVGSVLALELLGVRRITFSDLHDGVGTVKTAHGEVSVPVPAVLELTRGLPLIRVDVKAELLTPTGAAILTTLGTHARTLSARIECVGVACGTRDLPEQANILRVAVGDDLDGDVQATPFWSTDEVAILETNIDDMTPEVLAHLSDCAMADGALDIFVVPCVMKKGRSGHLVTILARPETEQRLIEVLLRETTTFGIRRRREHRAILDRAVRIVDSPWGTVQLKIGKLGEGEERVTPEFESCRRIAKEMGIPLQTVYARLQNWIRSTASNLPEVPH